MIIVMNVGYVIYGVHKCSDYNNDFELDLSDFYARLQFLFDNPLFREIL